MAHVHDSGTARNVMHQMQQEEGGDCAGVTGIVFRFSDLWKTRSPKTRAHVSTSGCMLGAVRGSNYNSIQGRIIQLCGTGGVTESARGTDSGHMEWTQSWAGWKTVACAEAEIGGMHAWDIGSDHPDVPSR